MYFTITSAAEQAGVKPGTLRTYEKLGLIRPARDSAGRRVYTAIDIVQARRVAAERAIAARRGLVSTRVAESAA